MIRFSVAIAPFALETAPILFRGDVFESMIKAKSMGYDAVEIHMKEASQVDPRKLSEKCKEMNMGVSAIGTGMVKVIDQLSLIDDRAEIREQAVSRIFEFVEWSAEVGNPIIIGSLRGNIPDFKNRARYDDRFYHCMNQILDKAEAFNVDIVLEVINRYENNFLNTVAEFLEFTKPIDRINLKAHLDTFHMNIEEANMSSAILACNQKCGYIHVADNNRHYVGAGSLNFKNVVEAAVQIGYDGYFSLECLPLPTAEIAAQESIKTMNALYQRKWQKIR